MPKSIKNIIVAKYKREKGELTQTFAFDEISESLQNEILSRTELSIEECLILRFVNNENWFLLSLDSIIINQNKNYQVIKYDDIIKVEPNVDLERLNKSGPYKIDEVKLICDTYEKVLDIEPGSWAVIVSIFLYLIGNVPK